MDARVVGIPEVDGTEQVAVVIDVMRAFTTAAWAFHRGADKIVLAADQGEALRIKASHPGWLALKDGAPASGFDLVNSPGRIREADLAGRTVVQKTTAGTVGALAVVEAELALCASFVVAGAAGDRPDAGPFLHRARTSPAADDLRGGRRRGAHPADVELCLEVDRFGFAMKVGLEDGTAVLRTRPDTASAAHRAP
ncbi:2-phosphosulfolactate phosphatase [Streptomyces sp. 1222.5]|uniref:2-phosphosulfolactate phosphatase n=1 Tax=unclassified Streptomyces TaxID=2593676 RepID=UPI00089580C1|nr:MULTISPECIES: 2-phosphosulfolactate phosphatase [unclassified Streptomyces]PKW05096.1 2-phosphosulfolactate phosphatase [Streptomyces sp. 5112.2]SEB54546.1 2-phosphosulfolactate phosphatase [Streptomyces sp. 1222.5]